MKTCYKCKITKEILEFAKSKREKDGLSQACKLCNKAYRRDNKERIQQYKIEYKEKFPEKIYEQGVKHRALYKELIAKKKKIYSDKHRDEKKAYDKKYCEDNSLLKQKQKALYNKSEKGRIVAINSRNKRRFIQKNSSDGTLIRDVVYPLSSELKELLYIQDNKCFYCKNELVDKHLDHYMPLSKGGTHSITNVVWSCAFCNLSKGAKLPEEYFESLSVC